MVFGYDYLGSTYTTYVSFAPKGSNFNAGSSYHHEASFAKEQLLAMSGDALLTIRTTGTEAVILRIFNGHGFGPAHVVPGTSGGAGEWFTVSQDPSGRIHVFSSRGLVRTYDLIEVSTPTGSTWTGARDLGHAIQDDYFTAALNSLGKGLVLGTSPAIGYPVP